MTPAQLRALLDAAMRRPWKMNGCHIQAPPFGDVSTVRATDDRPWKENGDAIVATMNAADALHDLWSALSSTGYTYRPDSEDPVERRIADALRRLEELP